jgi:hypothetical protein
MPENAGNRLVVSCCPRGPRITVSNMQSRTTNPSNIAASGHFATRLLASNLLVGKTRDVGFFAWLAFAASIIFVAYIARMNAITHDVFHEMALAREWFESGSFPLSDRFAYTPTVPLAVHHEWGTGLLLYWAGPQSPLGLQGIMALKFALVAALGLLVFRVARNGGAHPLLIIAFLPIALPMLWVGFATLRAQLFTLVAIAAQMLMFHSDWHGKRRWVFLWAIMYLVWLNVHAGFVVGLGMLGCHLVERVLDAWWRKQSIVDSVWHLFALGPFIALGILSNPWGWSYVPYLISAITMERPAIIEWKPLWFTHDPLMTMVVFAISAVMLGYAAKVRRWDRLRGWLFCVLAAYMALKHIRHGSIYAVVWLACVPAWLTPTPLGQSLIAWLNRSRFQVVRISQGLVVGCSIFAIWQCFWLATLPSTLAASSFCFPLGAVEFLKSHRVEGNVMTPFHCGAYVSWELHPNIKVSLDGRYEVAFTDEVLPEHQLFYEARSGWQAILGRYDHDFVLIPRDTEVAKHLVTEHPIDGWKLVYVDAAYGLIAREDIGLDKVQLRD